MLYICYYTVIQRRQLIYPLMYVVTFMQTLYWLSFYVRGPGNALSFLVGFRFMHLKFFPNILMYAIPAGYVGYASNDRFINLTIDSILIRNAGESLTLWAVVGLVVLFYSILKYLDFVLIKDQE